MLIKSRSYLYGVFATALNIIVNALTFGKVLWLEGRVRGGRFRNWARQFGYKPTKYFEPATEQEIVDLVRNSTKIRLFGSGHSFNGGVVSDATLVSLDKYAGRVNRPLPANQMAFRGGTRVRDVVRTLLDHGLAFKALPSHDAQSIGGILSTDVHGTGKDWGWVSEMVKGMRIINGNGDVHDVTPTDDLFKAAIGGIGAVGIISEVVVEAEPRFNVKQTFKLEPLIDVRNNLDTILATYDHVSLYIFPFADKCQVSIWDRTADAKSFLGPLREFIAISFDALMSAVGGNAMAYTGQLKNLSNWAYGFKRGTDLVMESNKAFNRTIYHLHQELEFTVPYADTWAMCDKFLKLYEDMYEANPRKLPYALLEVRFTPAGHDKTLIGAGRERRSTWIDLICNDSRGFEDYYSAAEDELIAIGARPHLGKYCEKLDKAHLQTVHGANFSTFLDLMNQHDPDAKFANDFTRRMFG